MNIQIRKGATGITASQVCSLIWSDVCCSENRTNSIWGKLPYVAIAIIGRKRFLEIASCIEDNVLHAMGFENRISRVRREKQNFYVVYLLILHHSSGNKLHTMSHTAETYFFS